MTWGERVPPWRRGVVYWKPTSDGREVGVYPEIPGTGKLYRGPLADKFGFDESWRFDSVQAAIDAAKEWDGESEVPPGSWKVIEPGPMKSDLQHPPSVTMPQTAPPIGAGSGMVSVAGSGKMIEQGLQTISIDRPRAGEWTPVLPTDDAQEVWTTPSGVQMTRIVRLDPLGDRVIEIEGLRQMNHASKQDGCKVTVVSEREGSAHG